MFASLSVSEKKCLLSVLFSTLHLFFCLIISFTSPSLVLQSAWWCLVLIPHMSFPLPFCHFSPVSLLLGVFSDASTSQKKRDPPCSLAHRVVLNLGEDVSWAHSPVEEANLWETMHPVSASSKTPLCQNTLARKLIYKVAAWFFFFLLYILLSTFPSSPQSFLRF